MRTVAFYTVVLAGVIGMLAFGMIIYYSFHGL